MRFDEKAPMAFPDFTFGTRKGKIQFKAVSHEVHYAKSFTDEIRAAKLLEDAEKSLLVDVVNFHVKITGRTFEHGVADKASDEIAFTADIADAFGYLH